MAAKSSNKRKNKKKKPMLFTKLNYKIMGIGILLIIIGFTAMRLENEVYGFVSLYLSPIVILAGYAIVGYSILKRDHKTDEPSNVSAG